MEYMDYNIGLNIKRLRLEKKITQRELADQFNVNHQTVSKWESNEHVPDVGVLPLIAEFFGVTIDDLFYDKKVKRYQHEQVIKEQYIELIVQHKFDEAKDLIETAYKKDRNNHFFMSKHIHYLCCECRSEDLDELVALSNKIASDCSDSSVVYAVTRDMIKYYTQINMTERAMKIAETQPTVWGSFEYLSCFASKGDDIRLYYARAVYEMVRALFNLNIKRCEEDTYKNSIKSFQRFAGMIKAMFPEGNYSEFTGLLCKAYAFIAKYEYLQSNLELAYYNLDISAKYFVEFFSKFPHTFPNDNWFSILSFDVYQTDNLAYNHFEEFFEDVPDFANQIRFKQIIDDAHKRAPSV